jgi:DNA-binding NarL/FixJ family response regulator
VRRPSFGEIPGETLEKRRKLTYTFAQSYAAMDMENQFTRLDAVVLDPHPIWLDAVEMILNRIGANVILKTPSASEALRTIEREQPRLLTLELDTPPGEPDGFEVVRRARTLAPSLRAIVLSTHSDPVHIDAAQAAGVAAYVLKTAHPNDVASAFRQAFDHSVYLVGASQPPGRKASGVALAAGSKVPGGLTRRELEILLLVAEGHSNLRLARTLWITEQTVKFHLSNIYRKLDVSNRTEASRWAQLNGLLSEQTPASESSVSA